MHRSGTSALTGVLHLLGVELSESLLPPNLGTNDRGFWEHRDILDVHERLLAALSSSWDDVRPLPDSWWTDKRVLPFRDQIIGILLRDFADAAVWGIKDPRMCRLMPLWLDIFKELGCRPRFMCIHRDPYEVAQSLKHRDGFAEVKSVFLWADHNLSAERWTRGRQRVFTSYDQLLSDPRGTMEKIERGAGCQLPERTDEAMGEVRRFLTPRLRHHVSHRTGTDVVFDGCASLVDGTYKALTEACEAETNDVRAAFDRLHGEYDAFVSSFDPALMSHIGDLQVRISTLNERLDRVRHSFVLRSARSLQGVGEALKRILHR
jgi:hypothetical protein